MRRNLSLTIEQAACLYFNLKLVDNACITGTGNGELDAARAAMKKRILKLYPEIEEALRREKL